METLKNAEIAEIFIKTLIDNSVDIDGEFVKIVDEMFWELL